MTGELPIAFVGRMEALLGEEARLFLDSYDALPVRGLRLNGLKGDLKKLEESCRGQFCLEQVPWAAEGFYVEELGAGARPGKHPYHEAGIYYLQEPSAMAAVALLEPKPGERVLDLCAAPGGKSTQIAGRMGGQGLLVSNEIHPARAKILSQNMERLGVSGAVVTSEDPEVLAERFPAFFDKILVDAPCSGEGMFRKDPGAREEWSVEAVALCAARQKKILEAGVQMLKPGGLLVYSTCTFSPEEDEGSVSWLLETHPEFAVEQSERTGFGDFGKGRPGWVPEGAGRKETEATYRIWPHKVKGEGHYLAVLRKAGAGGVFVRDERLAKMSGEKRPGKMPGEKIKGKKGNVQAEKEQQQAREQFRLFCAETLSALPWEEQPGRYLTFGEQLYYAPGDLPDMDGLKVLRPGLHLGTLKKNRFEPSHALALYLRPEHVKRQVSLPCLSREADRYLRGETLQIGELREKAAEIDRAPAAEGKAEKGWILVTVDGYSLGWGKLSGGTIKNHYPRGLRLQG